MTVDDLNILWLDLFEFLTLNKKMKLLEIVGKNNNIRSIFLTNPLIKQELQTEDFNKMALCLSDEYLNIRLKQYAEENVACITFYDERYPYMLKEISSPPLCLYCKGNLQLLNSFCLAVVGTRRPTDYGIVVTKQFVKDFCEADVTVVSGLAVGVDTIAHKTALENNGKTIAVLAGGFNHIYPYANIALAKEMTKNNLLVSEFNPNIKPQSYYFPIRNRIIAGLSHGVLVTEAGEKSGALHTTEYAIDFNRDIFAVPGRINAEMSRGTNNLIKRFDSSIMALSAKDVLNSFNIKTEKKQKNSGVQLDISVQLVLDYIQTDKKTFQEILDYTKMNAQDLNAMLLELEMTGMVLKLANNSYIMA